MKYLLITFLLLINISVYSQQEVIPISDFIKCFQNSEIKGELINSKNVKFDSIDVKIDNYSNMIETKSYFKKSKTEILIKYFFKNMELSYVLSNEFSSYSKEFWLTHDFCLENKKIIFENESPSQSAAMHGVAGPRDNKSIYDYYGYNKSLNMEFLKKYILELYEKIIN